MKLTQTFHISFLSKFMETSRPTWCLIKSWNVHLEHLLCGEYL